MMVILEELKYRNLLSVWEAHKRPDELRQYLKLKEFRRSVRAGKFTLYHIDEMDDRIHYYFTDKQ